MKLAALAASILLPIMAMGAPVEKRDEGNLTVSKFTMLSLLSGAELEYENGIYNIFAAVTSTNETAAANDNFEVSLEKLSFPADNGELSIFDVNGGFVGFVSYDKSNNFTLNIDSAWAQGAADRPYPTVVLTNVDESSSISKRAPKSSYGKYRGGGGMDGEVFGILAEAIFDWVSAKLFSKRDDANSNVILLPVFVQSPGVTFESILGFDEVSFSGSDLLSVKTADLFIDIDDVIDFENCEWCQLPISS